MNSLTAHIPNLPPSSRPGLAGVHLHRTPPSPSGPGRACENAVRLGAAFTRDGLPRPARDVASSVRMATALMVAGTLRWCARQSATLGAPPQLTQRTPDDAARRETGSSAQRQEGTAACAVRAHLSRRLHPLRTPTLGGSLMVRPPAHPEAILGPRQVSGATVLSPRRQPDSGGDCWGSRGDLLPTARHGGRPPAGVSMASVDRRGGAVR